jgi:8-amino-7-oxononanoate synthase
MRLDQHLEAALRRRRAGGLERRLRALPPGVLDMASNDYLGLSRHPAVIAAAQGALDEWGAGARASRLVSGHTPLHAELERALATWKGCAAALVFSSGYAANLAVVPSLAEPDSTGESTLICCDKRNHASLLDACRLAAASGARLRYYHSPAKLRRLLAQESSTSRRLIVTDAVFSMDGDLAALPELLELARDFNAALIVDDAHGGGVLGANGRGAAEYCGLHPLSQQGADVVQIGTLSKAFGSQGGYVAGSPALIEWLLNAARPFIYSTGLNPAACAAALAALRLIQTQPELRERLRAAQGRLTEGLAALELDVRIQPAPIIPVLLGDAGAATAFSASLLQEGAWCPAIRPPTVPAGTSRLRVTASAALSDADIERVLQAFAAARRQLL